MVLCVSSSSSSIGPTNDDCQARSEFFILLFSIDWGPCLGCFCNCNFSSVVVMNLCHAFLNAEQLRNFIAEPSCRQAAVVGDLLCHAVRQTDHTPVVRARSAIQCMCLLDCSRQSSHMMSEGRSAVGERLWPGRCSLCLQVEWASVSIF